MCRANIAMAAALAAAMLSVSCAHAANTHPIPRDGRIAFGPGRTTLDLTGADGKSLGVVTANPNNPQSSTSYPQTIILKGAISGSVEIPRQVYRPDDKGKKHPINVIDVTQETVPLSETKLAAGSISHLSIESLYFDEITQLFGLQNIFGTQADHVGTGVPVRIPDLYIDAPGVTLYSLVDLNVYLEFLPEFSLGDTFSVVDGLVPVLPGMMFSTTPFVFDPASGFSGTPYSGGAQAETMHATSAVPEPAAWILMLVGAGLTGASARHRRGLRRRAAVIAARSC
jgi:hypothetical protein